MNKHIKDYLLTTLLGHIFFVLALSAWLILIVKMNQEQYLTWLWQGTLIDLGLAYGVIKWVNFWKGKIANRKKHVD